MANWVGSKCERYRPLKEVAKLIRADVKEAIKKGDLRKLKTSVRCKDGRAIYIEVMEIPADFVYENFHAKNIELQMKGLAKKFTPMNEESEIHLNKLKNIANEYNYDSSDVQVDYFDSGFFVQVNYNYQAKYAAVDRQLEEVPVE